MSFWKSALLVASSVGLYSVASASAQAGGTRPQKKIFRDQDFWVVAHRGYSGRYPENTMLSFEKAAEFNIDAIELDVHTTRDGHVVVMHDNTVDRTTNRAGKILDHDWKELRRADAGYRFDPDGSGAFPFRGKNIGVPLLEDVFKNFPNMRFIIEIKQPMPGMEEPLFRLIRKYRMDNKVIVASEHHEPLIRFRRIAPNIATNFSREEAKDFYQMYRMKLSHFYRASGDALQIPEYYERRRVVNGALVASAKRKGVVMHIWTVNDPQVMKRLIADGVDGLITDHPDRLLELIKRPVRKIAPAEI